MNRFSQLARPPIQPEEAEAAPHSTCVYHGGLVTQTGDVQGRVFFCPIGRQYWRYSSNAGVGMYAPLPYRQERPI